MIIILLMMVMIVIVVIVVPLLIIIMIMIMIIMIMIVAFQPEAPSMRVGSSTFCFRRALRLGGRTGDADYGNRNAQEAISYHML